MPPFSLSGEPMQSSTEAAISVIVYDPTGRQSGETYPPAAKWFWTDGKPVRKPRVDRGQKRPNINVKTSADKTALSRVATREEWRFPPRAIRLAITVLRSVSAIAKSLNTTNGGICGEFRI
jgi:hypothetical protein